jgi:hypothetical protein
MATLEEKELTSKRLEEDRVRREASEKRIRREAMVKRIKDSAWTSVIASGVTIIFVTSMGWLTTQSVVEKARADGAKELIALRSGICLVRFQQRPDAATKLAEFKALPYAERDPAIRKLVADEGLATMLGQHAPAEGAVNQCADAIKRS